jgi:hypothetical protein
LWGLTGLCGCTGATSGEGDPDGFEAEVTVPDGDPQEDVDVPLELPEQDAEVVPLPDGDGTDEDGDGGVADGGDAETTPDAEDADADGMDADGIGGAPDADAPDVDTKDTNTPACPETCDDGDLCNGEETCDPATGLCVGGTPLDCDDGDVCTDDACDATDGCVHPNLDCDDGDACTIDSCGSEGCEIDPVDCSDGNACTIDSCEPQTGCVYGPPDCDDGDPCTDDGCNPNGGCLSLETDCDDENACTVDSCGASGCENTPLSCKDGNGCTIDSCEPETGCVHIPADCDDGDPCTDDGCNPNGGCMSLETDCDDENACTVDSCGASGCENTPLGCEDGNPCTIDSCEPAAGCVYPPEDCDDGEPCTDDGCNPDTGCLSSPTVCDDSDGCTTDTCVLGEGCDFAPVACATDGNPCTTESCTAGACGSTAVVCDDGNLCTTDNCNPLDGSCLYVPVNCLDDDLCDGSESCNPLTGACDEGEPVVCMDTNICDGINACDAATGTCAEGPPLDCYANTPDWDGCAGDKVCNPVAGFCQTQWLNNLYCPFAPGKCNQNGGVDPPTEGEIDEISPGFFVLRDDGGWEEREAIIDQIAEHPSVVTVDVSDILVLDLNRTAKAISPPPGLDCPVGGWTWNDGDQEVDYWWPQGVTGSADAWGDFENGEWGLEAGTDVMMVSWYHKAEEDSGTSTYKGVRVSIVNTWGLKYRHAILAEPVCNGTMVGATCVGTPTYEPLASGSSSTHAGGIVWYKNYLFVAVTTVGFKVFDLNRIQKVQTGEKNHLGYHAGDDVYYGYNYRYIIPQVGYYKLCGASCCARFSWAGFDGSTDPPSILAGEYDTGIMGRAHRWDLDPSTGRLATQFNVAKNSATYTPGVSHMQGGLTVQGHLFISSSLSKLSWPPSPGTLWDGAPGDSAEDHQWPLLPEDLYYDVFTDRLWTCTEEPKTLLKGNVRYCTYAIQSQVKNNLCD